MPSTVQGEVIRDIATGTALVLTVFTVSILVPLAGLFGALVIPLPVLFYRMKLGRGLGLIVPGATLVVIVTVAGSPTLDLLILAEIVFSGFFLGEMLKRNLSLEKTVGYTTGAVLVSGLALAAAAGAVNGSGLFALVNDYVSANLEISLSLYRQMGMPEERIERFIAEMDHIRFFFVRLLPGFAVTAMLFIVWVTLLMARPLLADKGLYFAPFGAFNRWRTPERMVWLTLAAGILLLLPATGVRLAGANLMMVLFLLYFFQGIAICSFFFERKKFPRMLKFFLYSLLVFQHILLILVIGLGFFDMWLNFRKLDVSEKPS